ncbi:hypothetical protein AOR13_1114 [Alteromonas stellipolaris LMG 21856]|nr:hypothetical protein AOR13_1114 [Alteromonas stellipolaris LMG 21856]
MEVRENFTYYDNKQPMLILVFSHLYEVFSLAIVNMDLPYL